MEIVGELLTGGWNLVKMGLKALGDFLGKLDGRGWAELIAAILAALAILHFAMGERHWRKQDGRDVKALNAELASEQKVAAHAWALKGQIDGLTANVSRVAKEWKNAQDARIAGAADDLRMRGPGKAVCPGHPVAPPTSSGPQQPSGAGNAPVAQVPDRGGANLIALPFNDTVDFGQSHDSWRTEALAWRKFWAGIEAIWPKSSPPAPNGKQ